MLNQDVHEPSVMTTKRMVMLSQTVLAPYVYISATALRGKFRASSSTSFRHAMHVLSILINYGVSSPILLKAALVHDILNEVVDFDPSNISDADSDGPLVLKLVQEISRDKSNESKDDFLRRIAKTGSQEAKILISASRIDTLEDLGFSTDRNFIKKYCAQTECFVLGMALDVNYSMYLEMLHLMASRVRFLSPDGYFCPERKKHA